MEIPFDALDPMTVIDALNKGGEEVALLNWQGRYHVTTFSWNDFIDSSSGREFVYHVKDEDWHPGPKTAIKAFLENL